jgi:hypothetical protein
MMLFRVTRSWYEAYWYGGQHAAPHAPLIGDCIRLAIAIGMMFGIVALLAAFGR